MKVFAFLATALLSSSVFASWPQDFQQIKNVPRSYTDAGAICEELARVQFRQHYNEDNYNIEVGIVYGDRQRVIGELDIVVFERATNEVVQIAEVKCWKDMESGLHKAHNQRQRFLANLKSRKDIFLQSSSTHQFFKLDQFSHVSSFTTVGQKGSVRVGYDDELEYELSELHRMSKDMIQCQAERQCAAPLK